MTKPRSSKAKGRTGQQEIRDMILERFPELEQGDVKSTTMGESGVDIQLSPAALKKLPVSIEVKRRKSFATPYNWYNQADREDGNEPVVFFRADRKKWLAIIDAEHYLNLRSRKKL